MPYAPASARTPPRDVAARRRLVRGHLVGIGRCGCVCGGECMLVNLSRRSVLVRMQAREHSHLPDALHVLQYRREGACANYPRRARPPRIWVRFPSPKLGQKILDILENKLSKSDFLTARRNSILIPTRNADGMWASIMSLQEQGFCEIRNSDNCGRRRGGRTLPRSWPRMSTTKPRMCWKPPTN